MNKKQKKKATQSKTTQEAAEGKEQEAAGGKEQEAAGGKGQEAAEGKEQEAAGGKEQEAAEGKEQEAAGGKEQEAAGGKEQEAAEGKEQEAAGGKGQEAAGGKEQKSAGEPVQKKAKQTVTKASKETATEASKETATEAAKETATEAAKETATEAAKETATEAAKETATEAAKETEAVATKGIAAYAARKRAKKSAARKAANAAAKETAKMKGAAANVTELKKAAGAEDVVIFAEAAVEDALPQKGKKKKIIKYITIIIILLLLVSSALVTIAYRRTMEYYQARFLPNTSINGYDCSDMEAESVVAILNSNLYGYVLDVTGRDYSTGESGAVLGRIYSEDIGLTYEGMREAVETLLEQQKEPGWIWGYLKGESESYTLPQNITFDGEVLEKIVKAWDACQNGNMRKAQDAYISGYSEEDNCYTIMAETNGTEFDVDKVVQLVQEAVANQKASLDIEGLGCYKEASVRKDDEKLNGIVDSANSWLSADITYDWNGTEVVVDYHILKDWVSIVNGKAILDEEMVAEFVKSKAAAYDTYGRTRRFTTTLGVEVTLSRSNYGWKTDTESETEELLNLIYQGSTEKREPIYSITAKQKGINDIGNSYVEADLTHQHLYLYQDGQIVLETDFVSGSMSSTPDCVTPEGVFGVTYKTTNRILRGADYATFVNYWMPYYGNYGMHDATWRSQFGGDIYVQNGSHGCINLPLDMAKQIYQYVSTGFPVICYYYDVDPLAGQNEPGWEEENDPEPEN